MNNGSKSRENYNYDNNEEYCDNVSEEEVMLPYFMSNEIKVYDTKTNQLIKQVCQFQYNYQ